MDFGALLATGVTIIALLGGAAAYFGKSRGDSIIQYQANEIALRDGTIARIEKELAATTAQCQVLSDQNKKLGELAQGNPQLQTLTKAIETLTKVVDAKLKGDS